MEFYIKTILNIAGIVDKDTWATLHQRTLPTMQKVKIAADKPPAPTVPRVGGFSSASIKAVADMRSALDATMKADPTPSLATEEQHLLMLRFNLETHDYVMQSHTWLDVESAHNNWQGLADKD